MSFDPAKRLFISGLPPDVTKKELADFVRMRSKANPSHIEIALDENKNCRGFAHMTVEGIKGVIEGINGLPLRGHRITADRAKPHYSVAIVAAKKQREAAAEKNLASAVADDATPADPETVKDESEAQEKRAPEEYNLRKDIHYLRCKRKYAQIASQVAAEQLAQHLLRNPRNVGSHRWFGSTAAFASPKSGFETRAANRFSSPNTVGSPAQSTDRKRPRDASSKGRAPAAVTETAPPKPAPPPAEPTAPPPSKEERKIKGLQARLEQLQRKLKSVAS